MFGMRTILDPKMSVFMRTKINEKEKEQQKYKRYNK